MPSNAYQWIFYPSRRKHATRDAHSDKGDYDRTANEVARRFEANFAQFAGKVDERVRASGIRPAA